MSNDDSTHLRELIRRWRDDKDQDAATEIYRRYEQRLIRLADNKLGAYLRSVVGPEDIALMANRSLLRMAAEKSALHLDKKGSLWGLAARITMLKILKEVAWHTAQKRDIRRRQSSDADADSGSSDATPEPVSKDPSPEELAQMNDLLATVRRSVEPDEYAVMTLHLEGYSNKEIAERLGTKTSMRSVGRKLDHATEVMRRLLDDGECGTRQE